METEMQCKQLNNEQQQREEEHMKNAIDLVRDGLKCLGADGLCAHGCACPIDELSPDECMDSECVAAKRIPMADAADYGPWGDSSDPDHIMAPLDAKRLKQRKDKTMLEYKTACDTIYLQGEHDGWIVNIKKGGLEIITPSRGELEIIRECRNAVSLTEYADPCPDCGEVYPVGCDHQCSD